MTGHLKTKLGNIGYNVTSKDHVYFNTDPVNVNGEDRLILRGIPYYVGLHLYKRELGTGVTFGHGASEWVCESVQDLHTARCDMWEKSHQVSHAARRDLFGAIVDAWSAFGIAELLRAAEKCNLDNQMLKHMDRIKELRAEIVKIEQLLHTIGHERRHLEYDWNEKETSKA